VAIALALIAAAIFALGTVLQQRVAMTAPDQVAHSPLFMLRLARSPAWLAGIAATGLGFLFHAAALGAGQLALVQPILALTLVFALPLGARLSSQRIEPVDVRASLLLMAALGAFLAISNPAAGIEDPSGTSWLLLGGPLALLSALLTWQGVRRRPALKATLAGTATGVLFGLHGALTKGVVEQLDAPILTQLGSWELYAFALVGFTALGVSQIALQAGDLPPAIATESIASPLIGVLLGIALFEESLHEDAAGTLLIVASLAAMAVGIALLARRQGRTGAR
jgi:drug/metabolite transporter (DMT)-like permease